MRAKRTVIVPNPLGLHVRPSTAFSKLAASFASRVEIAKDSQAVNGKSSVELLTLAAVQGSALVIRAEGDDAEAAVEALAGLVESGFGER